MKNVWALVAAAGSGIRLGGQTPKQFLRLGTKPLLVHALEAFNFHPGICGIVIVAARGWEPYSAFLARKHGLDKVRQVVTGGEDRQSSVFCGLQALDGVCDAVLIHDGARPFVSDQLIGRILYALEKTGAAIPAIAVKDTLKLVAADGAVVSTPDRSQLVAVQTPQGFCYSTIMQAHRQAADSRQRATDDASLMEQMGMPVVVVAGEETNIKVTTGLDLQLANLLVDRLGKESAREP